MKNKTAFTLAEVLITLTIIGVVAAITVPTLIQRTNKQEYVTALQKAYSTLSQTANMIIAENGSPKCDDGGWACSSEDMYNMFKNYLSSAKDCGTAIGCLPAVYKLLNGGLFGVQDGNPNFRYLVLSDGTQIRFDGTSADCSNTRNGSKNFCAWMFVDINGSKNPNILGRDLFEFILKEEGLYPIGCDEEETAGCSMNKSGRGCACKVLREGKMDY